MKIPAALRPVLLAAVFTVACSHSDPTGSWFPPDDGPLHDTPPIRLTYSSGTDVWPAFSQDGTRLLYAYELGTPDEDRCLGVLPAVGGQRVAEVCDVDTSPSVRDGFEHGALSSAGILAFTRHSGDVGGPTANGGSLYVAPIDSLAGARKVFDLKTTVPGAGRRWDYLLDPTWISDTELAFVGTQVAYIPPGPFLPEDTIYTGLDLAKVRLDGGPAQVTVLADLGNAQALAYDPTLSRFAFLRNDSVFTIPATGGAPALYFALPETTTEFDRSVTGVAAGGGKIWITWVFRDAPPGISRVRSRIDEVSANGALTTLWFRDRITLNGTPPVLDKDEGRWGRIAASGDGTRLSVEGRFGPTGDDIYLLELE